ncbi:MAG TPA: response regulator, partial [Longimicrobiales bacterium]
MSKAMYTQLNARILIVDDDGPARQLVRKYLASRGTTVFEAENAYYALGRLTEAEVDLVITDINMPGRSGLWLIDEVRTRWPGLPIIVTTAEDIADQVFRELVPNVTIVHKP